MRPGQNHILPIQDLENARKDDCPNASLVYPAAARLLLLLLLRTLLLLLVLLVLVLLVLFLILI